MVYNIVYEWMCIYTPEFINFNKPKTYNNFKMLERHYRLLDHMVYICGKNLNRDSEMRKSAYKFVFCLVLLSSKLSESLIDITVDLKRKCSNSFWDYEHIGYAYGQYDSFLYKLKQGFKCKEVRYGTKVIWSSAGEERAVGIILSGRGRPEKIVEIDLDNEEVFYFHKKGHFGKWKLWEKNILK